MTYRLVVWLHLLGAVVWIGGMIYLAAVMAPLARREGSPERGADLLHRATRGFRWLAWPAVTLLVLTGIANLALRGGLGPSLATVDFWASPYGTTLAIKLLLVLILIELALWADFRIGPRAARAARAEPEGAGTRRLQGTASFLRWALVALALGVTGLGVLLSRGWPG